jgi:hypothetical protein
MSGTTGEAISATWSAGAGAEPVLAIINRVASIEFKLYKRCIRELNQHHRRR